MGSRLKQHSVAFHLILREKKKKENFSRRQSKMRLNLVLLANFLTAEAQTTAEPELENGWKFIFAFL